MLRQDPTPAHLEQALAIIERALLRVWCSIDTDGVSVDAICANQSVDRRELRDLATTLRLPDPGAGTLKEWCAQANELLRTTSPAEHLSPGRKGRLSAPSAEAAKPPHSLIDAVPPATGHGPRRSDVIHQLKGSEAEAVLLIVPDASYTPGLMESWERGTAAEDEGLRVL